MVKKTLTPSVHKVVPYKQEKKSTRFYFKIIEGNCSTKSAFQQHSVH